MFFHLYDISSKHWMSIYIRNTLWGSLLRDGDVLLGYFRPFSHFSIRTHRNNSKGHKR